MDTDNATLRTCSTAACDRGVRIIGGQPRGNLCEACHKRAQRQRAASRDLEGKPLDELRAIAKAIGATHAPKSKTAGVAAAIGARRAELSFSRTGFADPQVTQRAQTARARLAESERWQAITSTLSTRDLWHLSVALGVDCDPGDAKRRLAGALTSLGSKDAAMRMVATAQALTAAEDAARAAYVPAALAPGELDGVELKADTVYWPRKFRELYADHLPLPMAMSLAFVERLAPFGDNFEPRQDPMDDKASKPEAFRAYEAWEEARDNTPAWHQKIGELAGFTLAMFDDLKGRPPEDVKRQIEDVRLMVRTASGACYEPGAGWELSPAGLYMWVTASGMRLAVGQDRFGKRAWWWKLYVDAGKGPKGADYIASGHAPNKHEAKLRAFKAHWAQLQAVADASDRHFSYASESKAQRRKYASDVARNL